MVSTERLILTGEDTGARCTVNTGWAKGRHGYIVGAWEDSGGYFTVQLDDRLALVSQVPAPTATRRRTS